MNETFSKKQMVCWKEVSVKETGYYRDHAEAGFKIDLNFKKLHFKQQMVDRRLFAVNATCTEKGLLAHFFLPTCLVD